MRTRNLAARAGHWSARHRKKAIFGWLALVVVALFIGAASGTKTLRQQDQGNGQSREANKVLANSGGLGQSARSEEQVLIQSRTGGLTVKDPAFRKAIEDVAGRVARTPHSASVQSPLAKGNGGQISGDSRSALLKFQIKGSQSKARHRVGAFLSLVAAAQRAHPELRIEEAGDASADKALTKAFEDDFRKAETLSLPITLAILLVAFGALVAAGLPLLLGLSAVAITLGLVAPLSHIWRVDQAISSVVLLIGLAVGVDYSLFYIRREREERKAGRSKDAALEAAAATSGRAVLVSGLTVMVAMAGMYLTGNSTFASFGTGTIMVVAVAMLGSMTVLPALLSKLGDGIDRGRVPFVARLRARRGEDGGVWAWIVDRVLRRPVVSVVLAGGALVALAIPAFSLHTVDTGIQGLPPNLPITKTIKRIERPFPGGPIPALVVVQAKDVTSPAVAEGIHQMELRALATGYTQEPINARVNPSRTVAEVLVPLAGSGTDSNSNQALRMLRKDVIPLTIDKVRGTRTLVTGLTAGSRDFNNQMKSRAPWVFAFVLGLAFVLLMITFRSIVIPLKAIVLNLLSVGAAYGVLVLIFQDGRLQSLLGYKSIGGVTSWLPLFLFVILFGLSMDYHVLILTRVREAYDRGMATEQAVAQGIRATAGVVTSAAIVMVAVFAIFATLSSLDFKMMGIGLATAVLIDATIVRAVLLPATMKLLGDWNWYLPSWLGWLPGSAHEPALAGSLVAAGDRPAVGPEGAPGGLSVDVVEEGETLRVVFAGELDLNAAGWVGERLRSIEADHPRTLVLDLRGLGFMDSSGLRELFAANRRARAEGRRLVLVKGSRPIDRVLELVRAAEVVETVDDPGSIGPDRRE